MKERKGGEGGVDDRGLVGRWSRSWRDEQRWGEKEKEGRMR